MKNTMIGFLTNEPVPKRLREALQESHRRSRHASAQKDGPLSLLAVIFFIALIGLIVLEVIFFRG